MPDVAAPPPPPDPGSRVEPPPTVAARAVIVYEPEPRRKWGLWVFTAVMVALTTGVVLGQAVAWQPVSSTASAAQTVPLPTYSTPPAVLPGPADLGPAATAQRVSAPLGTAKTQTLEVTGIAAVLQIRSADLDGLLFDVVTTDGGTNPSFESTARGPRLTLARTGAQAPTGPVGILVSSKVTWTIRVSGGFVEQQIDLRSSRVAGIELVGEAAHAVLDLPAPTGTLPITIRGAVQNLRIRAAAGVPARLRLAKGADSTMLDGKQRQKVGNGTISTTAGWSAAKARYDMVATARVTSATIEHAP